MGGSLSAGDMKYEGSEVRVQLEPISYCLLYSSYYHSYKIKNGIQRTHDGMVIPKKEKQAARTSHEKRGLLLLFLEQKLIVLFTVGSAD